MSEAKKSWFKKLLLFLRNNYNWLPVIPIVFGSLYQCYSISAIGYQYLRFFSLTQVLIDGVIFICFFLFLIICSFLLYFIIRPLTFNQDEFYHYPTYNEEVRRKKRNKKHSTIAIILTGLIVLIFGYISYEEIINLNFFMSSYLFFLSIYFLIILILNQAFKIQEYKHFPGIGFSKPISRGKRFLFALISISFYSYFVLISYPFGYAAKGIKAFSFNDLNNTSNLYNHINCSKIEFSNFKSEQIIYYNDKYLFSEIITENDTIVKISSFEDFINGNCKFD